MWTKVARLIIAYRLYLIILIGLITIVMGYLGTKVELSYEFNRTVPLNDPEQVLLTKFKAQFGEDGDVIAIGLKDSSVYQLRNFNLFRKFAEQLKAIPGIKSVRGLPLIQIIRKDTEHTRFNLVDLFSGPASTPAQLDSLMRVMRNQKVYMGQLVNTVNGATMLVVTIQKEVMNSSKRVGMTNTITAAGTEFSTATGIQLHYTGLPYIRTMVANQVRHEMSLFLFLSALVTGIIMFLFFRSFRAVFFSMIIIGIAVIWVFGTLVLFGYKITLLSALIPPVIVTIGITNAIYLLNKYHVEFAKHRDKERAIATVINKMGLATFLTNLTVAIGFLTLLSTDITILREFGIVAGINIMALFIVTLIMIPSVFSWLPPPSPKHLHHLDFKVMGSFVKWIDKIVLQRRAIIYALAVTLAVVSGFGMLKLKSVSFMVDDVPEDNPIKKDLKFFETNFSGIMPLEIMVDTEKRGGLKKLKNLQKIDAFENFLDSLDHVSPPISIISAIKAFKQAFYNGNPGRYSLPANEAEKGFILKYLSASKNTGGLLKSLADSSLQKMHISLFIADMGSLKLDSLVGKVIEPRMNAIFKDTGIQAWVTGSTKIFIRGNKFLIENLRESLLLAFILITLSMAILFADVRMIVISLIPNLIALMITAGIMGYFGIPLKPSTALIFSITFGISVDNSIRFLAKYRQEMFANNFRVPISVSESILETGKSIMYTSIVLFAGFIIFAFSKFGGTIALGVLTSTTLVISMFTNLILLPALIMTFDKSRKGKKELIDEVDTSF